MLPRPPSPTWSDAISADLSNSPGTAVGAAFVGVVTACLAVAQGARAALLGGGFDVTNLHLQTCDVDLAPATYEVDVIVARLCTL